MAKEILYNHALDNGGRVIKIEAAKTGSKYFCTVCHNEMIFKNGDIRQKHFSHKNTTENCGGKGGSGGEGYLHETFKNIAFQYIKELIKENKPLGIEYKCIVCNTLHKTNLLGGMKDINIEYNIENCRPDLALVDINNNIPIIIEIVDKHEPEQNVIDLCNNKRIVLIRYKLNDINDLEIFEEKIKKPDDVRLIDKMQCPLFVQMLQQQQQKQNSIKQQFMYQQLMQQLAYQPRSYSPSGARIDTIDKQLDRYGSYSPKRNGGRSYGSGKSGRSGKYGRRK